MHDENRFSSTFTETSLYLLENKMSRLFGGKRNHTIWNCLTSVAFNVIFLAFDCWKRTIHKIIRRDVYTDTVRYCQRPGRPREMTARTDHFVTEFTSTVIYPMKLSKVTPIKTTSRSLYYIEKWPDGHDSAAPLHYSSTSNSDPIE